MYSAPPAATAIFLVLSSGSAILIPPSGGRRLPWKSLIARIRKSTGAPCAWARGAGPSANASIAAAATWQNEYLMTFHYPSWPGFVPPSTSFLLHCYKDVDARHKAGHDELCYTPSW